MVHRNFHYRTFKYKKQDTFFLVLLTEDSIDNFSPLLDGSVCGISQSVTLLLEGLSAEGKNLYIPKPNRHCVRILCQS